MKSSKKSLSSISRVVALSLLALSISCGASFAATSSNGDNKKQQTQQKSSSKQQNKTVTTAKKNTRPTVGSKVTVVPSKKVDFVYKNKSYSFCDGIIYTLLSNKQYVVAELVKGMVIPSIPEHEMQEIIIKNKVYYEHYGVIYKVIYTRGAKQYEVYGWRD